MFNLDLIIFAKSIKHHNFCVAGKNKINNELTIWGQTNFT